MATRMRPVTERIPKALLEVAGEPFLAHQLRYLAGQGVRKVVMCVAHMADKIEAFAGNGRQFGLDLYYSHDGDKLLGTAGALRRARPLLGDQFFILYGDSYLPTDFTAVQRTFDDSGKMGLMTVFYNQGKYDGSNIHFEQGKILVYDKVNVTDAMKHIDYGLGLLRSSALDSIPTDVPVDLGTIYRKLLVDDQLAAHEIAERFYEIGSFQGWEETCHLLQQHRAAA